MERLDGGAFRYFPAGVVRAIAFRWREILLLVAVSGVMAASVAIAGTRLETLYLDRLYRTANEGSQYPVSRAEGLPDVTGSLCSGSENRP